MAKVEPLDEPIHLLQQHRPKKTVKRNHGSVMFFVCVDYVFLLIFIAFLCFLIVKMFGV